MKNGQRPPEPTLATAAANHGQQQSSNVLSKPAEQRAVTVLSDRVELLRPLIRLNANFSSDLKRPVETQSMNLTPERAYISHGCIFVDELKVWFPLNTVQIGRWS